LVQLRGKVGLLVSGLLAAGILIGQCTYYAPGVMERQATYHGWTCPPAGCVAVGDCRMVGEFVLLISPTGARSGPHLIADCGKFLTPGRIGEVGWDIAERWHMLGPVDCQIIPWQPRWYTVMEEP